MTKWRKSSFSGAQAECVETAVLEDGSIGVRDSKHGEGSPVLSFTRTEISAFIKGVKAGEFDDLT